MTNGQVPQHLIDILDRHAGRTHSANGKVVTALAEILHRQHLPQLVHKFESDWNHALAQAIRWNTAATLAIPCLLVVALAVMLKFLPALALTAAITLTALVGWRACYWTTRHTAMTEARQVFQPPAEEDAS